MCIAIACRIEVVGRGAIAFIIIYDYSNGLHIDNTFIPTWVFIAHRTDQTSEGCGRLKWEGKFLGKVSANGFYFNNYASKWQLLRYDNI